MRLQYNALKFRQMLAALSAIIVHSCIHSPKMSFNHSHISGRVMCSTPSVSSIELPIALKSN